MAQNLETIQTHSKGLGSQFFRTGKQEIPEGERGQTKTPFMGVGSGY